MGWRARLRVQDPLGACTIVQEMYTKEKPKRKNQIAKTLTSKIYNSSTKSMKVNMEKLMGL